MVIFGLRLGFGCHPSGIESHFLPLRSRGVLQYRRVARIIVRIFLTSLLDSLLAPAFHEFLTLVHCRWRVVLEVLAAALRMRGLGVFATRRVGVMYAVLRLKG